MANNINFLRDLLIAELQKQPIYYNLPPYSRDIVNQVISKVAISSSQKITKDVQLFSNNEITNNQKNIIGPYNQYDVLNSNINSSTLSSRLLPNATQQLLGGLTNDMVFNLLKGLNDKLPAAFRNIIDLNQLTGILTNIAGGVVGTGISTSLSTYTGQILSGNRINIPIIGGLDAGFASLLAGNPSAALGRIESVFASAVTQKALSAAQSFDINNPLNKEKLITQTKGFNDPTATYPTKEYKSQPDTNKLARGDVKGTIVQEKEQERLKGIQLPNGQSWEEPSPAFKGQYPYNKVTETESGHIIELDDTEGAERIHVYHKSGTYIEIDANGSIVRRTKGSSYEIIDKNGYISVTGDASVSVKGSVKVYVGGDADIEVEGDVNLTSFNDITMQAAGRVDISATEEINLHSANINIEADVNLHMKGDVNAFLTAKDYYVKANNNSYHEVLANMYTKAGTSMFNQAGSQVHFKSGGTFNVDGSATYLQSGTSVNSTTSKYANSSNIGLLGLRKTIVYNTIPDPISPNYIDALGEKGEDSLSSSDSNAQSQRLKNLGAATGQDLSEKGITIESDNPRTSVTNIIRPSGDLLRVTSLPDNYQLSKHFTLGDLSTKATVSKYKVVPQNGLTYGQIVYNLATVALNILEPVLALYPNMIVTSAFRTLESSNPNSQHTKGQAVDIQIPTIGPKNKLEYYDVAKKIANNINYDQLLLEYKNYGTGMPWIHISISADGNRNQVLTLYNDKKFTDGLAKVV